MEDQPLQVIWYQILFIIRGRYEIIYTQINTVWRVVMVSQLESQPRQDRSHRLFG